MGLLPPKRRNAEKVSERYAPNSATVTDAHALKYNVSKDTRELAQIEIFHKSELLFHFRLSNQERRVRAEQNIGGEVSWHPQLKREKPRP
jgi:hypothetical protein